MALGPGKYDDETTEIRERLQAAGVVLVVFGGAKGNGFSCQATIGLTAALPAILREMANEIEQSGASA